MHEGFISRLAVSPFRFKLFLLRYLPMAFLAGLKIVSYSPGMAVVSVRYRYLTQNPFRSVYFACLAMAAELSSGLLVLDSASKGRVSTLVTGLEARFLKKATGETYFTCPDGDRIRAEIGKTLLTGNPVTFSATATGLDREGNKIAEFTLHWSCKRK
ncbi:MAG: DUF4442 domain-containing protein [Bacteroidetes bacterium]|nr:DUF4442 domain-containing protein [Bacteroidota bacterium]